MAEPSTESGSSTKRTESAALPKVGIALGAGGAKGIAHIPMLEAFDELGITPHRIAGSSIGAVMGTLYASGLTAKEMKDLVAHLAITKGNTFREVIKDRKVSKWMAMIDPDFGNGGIINGGSILDQLCVDRPCSTFEELPVPLTVIATDFWQRRAVVLDSGPLKPAVQASMALPGVFTPIELDGLVLIDGGTVNPLPYDVLMESCDIVVAVDINIAKEADQPGSLPGYFDTVFGSIQIMQQAIVEREIAARPPHIYIKPDLHNIRTLEFNRADEVYRQAQTAKEELKRRLAKEIERYSAPRGVSRPSQPRAEPI